MVQTLSRRDRVRAATKQEIIQTGRRLVVEQGPSAVTLRAIAREMGMTAPALYRYFDSHEELLGNVIADIFAEVAEYVRAAIRTAADSASRRLHDGDVVAAKMIAGCLAFRSWAFDHVPEFSMIFGSPQPGLEPAHDDPTAECGRQLGMVFLDMYTDLYRRRPFPVPADEDIVPSLRRQLTRYRASVGSDLPLGAMQTFLRCWVRLYGAVSLEVFGHLRFALDDAEPMFELELAGMAGLLGLQYPPARDPARGDLARSQATTR